MDNRLQKFYSEQLDFLKLSCDSFDNGYIHEAKRLATTLRVLLHDTSKSHSLLSQLDIKNKIGFIDTSLDLNPLNFLSHNGILLTRLSGKSATYFAPLNDSPLGLNHSKDFDTWWNKLVLAKSKDDGFSRKQIILDLANKEGGAHVDPKLNKRFESLTNGEYLNISFVTDHDTSFIEDAPAFAVRQIAFEVIKSLESCLKPNYIPTTVQFLLKTKAQNKRKTKLGRNDLCYCGSGEKYKRCCINKSSHQ